MELGIPMSFGVLLSAGLRVGEGLVWVLTLRFRVQGLGFRDLGTHKNRQAFGDARCEI